MRVNTTWPFPLVRRTGTYLTSAAVGIRHRRSMETEAKTKVVASVWEAKFIKFLAALAVLPRSIRNKRLSSSFSFK